MIILMTDYGVVDPYVGMLKSRLAEFAPSHLVIDLLHAVPAFNAHSGAHLLAAFANGFPIGSVFLSVVDPGVGTDTLMRASTLRLNPNEMLARHDSHGFFSALGDLVMTGATRTNVNDYRAMLIGVG